MPQAGEHVKDVLSDRNRSCKPFFTSNGYRPKWVSDPLAFLAPPARAESFQSTDARMQSRTVLRPWATSLRDLMFDGYPAAATEAMLEAS
jgi:hypothetical protein